jgi:hypothetical protein
MTRVLPVPATNVNRRYPMPLEGALNLASQNSA